jgi:hypothetical protein
MRRQAIVGSSRHRRSRCHRLTEAGTATTHSLSVNATEAESGVLDGAVCSFDPDTQVVVADGTTKAIKDVQVGDRVEAGDPATGQDQGGRAVTALHHHQDDDLLNVIVAGRMGSDT